MVNQAIRKSWMALLMAAIVIGQFGFVPKQQVAEAADNGLAQKPYMGWSTFSLQVYDGPSGWTSAAKIKEQSDAMHEKLQAHGYEYINIDAGWNGSMDEYGRPIPSTTLYPNGFQEVIDYVHNNGQKIGIYMIPGLSPQAYEADLPIYNAPGCSMKDIAAQPLRYGDYWNIGYKIDFQSESSRDCAQAYIDSLAEMIASWGIDFLKYDSVTPGSGHNNTSIDARDDVAAWSKALAKQDHKIWFELSWALDHNYIDFWKEHANGWRVNWDVESYDPKVGMTQWANIARLFPDAALWWRDAGPGGWNDFDSLNIGNGMMNGLTKDERQTAMTLWAMSSAQLYTGDDLTKLDDYGLSLLTNDEVIAVNQAGRPAHPVSMETNQQVWYANNGDGTYTVALFNLGTKSTNVTVNWSDIGLSGEAAVRDLWSHKNLGSFKTGYTAEQLEPHASRLFKVTAKNGTSSVNDDDTGMRYTGDWVRNGGHEQTAGSQELELTIKDSSTQEAVNSIAVEEASQPFIIEPAESDSTEAVDANANATDTDTETSDTSEASEASATVETALINDDNAAIVYTGNWGHSTNRSFGDYQQDVHYTQTEGDDFSYTFTGTGIEIMTEKDASQGSMEIYLDGQLQETVDTSSTGERLVQQTVFSRQDLNDGEHTIKAVKKSNNGDDYMLLDALRVTTGPTEQSSAIAPQTANFDLKTSAQADVHTVLTLNGNTLTGIANKGAGLTEGVDYSVQDDVVAISKAYLAAQPLGTMTLTFTFSAGEAQTLKVTIINSTSNGSRYMNINNDDPAILYNGSWSRNSGRGIGDYKDDVQFTEKNGDWFQYAFQGTGIKLITEMDESQGEMDIYIDGEFKGTVDTHHDGRLTLQTVYEISGLTNSQHTIKAVKKSGTFMLLDMLQVQIPSLIDPATAEFDKNPSAQSDLNVTLLGDAGNFSGITNGTSTLVLGTDYTASGGTVTISKSYLASLSNGEAKLTFHFEGDHGEDVHATGTNGDYFTYTFKGTGAALYMPTGPQQGEVEVYVDGELKQTIHTSAEVRTVQQRLFEISGLSDKFHTIKAVKKSGALMLVDQIVYEVGSASVVNPSPGSPSTSIPPSSGSGEAIYGTVGGAGSANNSDALQLPITRTTQADGSKKDTVTLTKELTVNAIQKLTAAGLAEVVISIPDGKKEVAETKVTLAKEAVQTITQAKLDLRIDTVNASVLIPNESLSGVQEDVTFTFTPVRDAGKQDQLASRSNAASIVIAAADGQEVTLIGQPIAIETNLQHREVSVILPLDPAALEYDKLGVYIEHSDGTTAFVQGTIVEWQGGKGLQVNVDHFSTFAAIGFDAAQAIRHAAYMKGVAGDLFKPEQTLTRAEMATILSRVADAKAAVANRTYSDVADSHWAAEAIAAVTGQGLMQGFADGTFRPSAPISRAEMAAVAAKLLTGEQKEGAGFSDIQGSWAEQAILSVQGAGVIQGYADGTFRPQQLLTRAEAVVIINRALGRGPLSGVVEQIWADVPTTHWAFADIAEASLDHQSTVGEQGGETIVR
ncbi:hypothetical protein FHS18_003795 [Paenibacillus phyllosphaerae]|uniref:Alpha-galactosidase n=1 Tax=Paenibacillus phyllosphaerae TaxID=274593 RepID=A0A7W5AZN1_9BACL|nr:X2-like carbohydrate binding domain-containing protein [Paenibacillus phyllosphaerae]MBB3111727.1 hypothetical protein [Paenibacillus phyllosphaerae]